MRATPGVRYVAPGQFDLPIKSQQVPGEAWRAILVSAWLRRWRLPCLDLEALRWRHWPLPSRVGSATLVPCRAFVRAERKLRALVPATMMPTGVTYLHGVLLWVSSRCLGSGMKTLVRPSDPTTVACCIITLLGASLLNPGPFRLQLANGFGLALCLTCGTQYFRVGWS